MSIIHVEFGGASAPSATASQPKGKTYDEIMRDLERTTLMHARSASGSSPEERRQQFQECLAAVHGALGMGLTSPGTIDRILHLLIEARMMEAEPGCAALEEEASPGAPLGARELAAVGSRWINEELEARASLSPDQRAERAKIYIETVRECMEEDNAPVWMAVIARNAWGARIMMAEKD